MGQSMRIGTREFKSLSDQVLENTETVFIPRNKCKISRIDPLSAAVGKEPPRSEPLTSNGLNKKINFNTPTDRL